MFDAVWMKHMLWKYVELIEYFKLVVTGDALKRSRQCPGS